METFIIIVIAVVASLVLMSFVWSIAVAVIDKTAEKRLTKIVSKMLSDKDEELREYKRRYIRALDEIEGDRRDILMGKILIIFKHIFDEPIWFESRYDEDKQEWDEKFVVFKHEIDQIREVIGKNFNVKDEAFLTAVADRLNRLQIGRLQ